MAETVAGEVALHLEVDGTGPALLLAHGFGGSARNWRPQIRDLRDAFRVAAFDVRGHARSAAPDAPAAYAPECFVADFARVLDHLGVGRTVVGGLSMGAGLAARFALDHPERVRALVLLAFPPGARPKAAQRAAGERSSPGRQQGRRPRSEPQASEVHRAGWALAFAGVIEREGLEAAGARYAWGPESGLDPVAAHLVQLGFREHPPHAIAHTLRQVLAAQPAAEEVAAALAPLDLPTLLLVGGADAVSRAPCEALARALPHAELVVIEGAGHVVNLEARAATSAALRAFLERLGPD